MRALHLLTLGLLAWTHIGWGLFLRIARRLGLGRATDDREARPASPVASASGTSTGAATTGQSASTGGTPAAEADDAPRGFPLVSIVIAAYAEQDAIAATVEGLIAQSWPRDRLQIIVACDGSPDATAERARAAGADLVLELERGGKHHAQAAGVAQASGEILAFSDANTSWAPTALAELVAAFDDPRVGYACGRVSFVAEPARGDGSEGAAPNQEGAYWRVEMALRRQESDWWSVTAGNGAIYALRAELWSRLRVGFGHDLALPHQVVRHGLLAVDRSTATATEPMVPTIDGEWRRKRRMMNQAWRVVLRGGDDGGLRNGLLDPTGVPIPYLAALVSHRWLRYASPFLHLLAYAAGVVIVARGDGGRQRRRLAAPGSRSLARAAGGTPTSRHARPRPTLHLLLLAAHLAVPLGAAAATRLRWRPLLLCRYYVLMTASIGFGLVDHLRHGTPAGWDPAEGTR